MIEKPMYPSTEVRQPSRVDNRQPLIIRYYRKDGSVYGQWQAKHDRTKQLLRVPGNKPVVIAAPHAIRLGLIDWMPYKPPRTNFPHIWERETLERFHEAPPDAEDLAK